MSQTPNPIPEADPPFPGELMWAVPMNTYLGELEERIVTATDTANLALDTAEQSVAPTDEAVAGRMADDGSLTAQATDQRIEDKVSTDTIDPLSAIGSAVENVAQQAVTDADVPGQIQSALDAYVPPSLPFATATLAGGTYTLDPTVAVDYSFTLADDSAIDAASMIDGTMLYVEIKQDAIGGHVLTLPVEWLRVGTIALHTDPNQLDIFCIWKTPTGVLVKQVTDLASITPPWTPESLANKVGWYNAAQVAGDAGDPVPTWVNQWSEASLARTGSFTAPTLQVVNGVNVLRFNGTTDAIATGTTGGWSGWQSTKSQPMTYAMVLKASGAVPGGTLPVLANHNNGNSSTTDHSFYVQSSATGEWTIKADLSFGGAANIPSQYITLIGSFAGSSSKIRVNGAETTGTVTLARGTNGMLVGMNSARTRKTVMDMAELIVVNQNVSGQDLADMEAYLNAKRDTLNGV